MNTRSIIHGVLIGCATLCLCGLATAEPMRDPVLKFEAKTEVELDLGIMVEDLLPLLMDALAEGDQENVEMAGFFIDLLGLKALDRWHMESSASKDQASSIMTLTLDKGMDGGLLAEVLAIPQGKCGFAKYVPRDGLVFFSTVLNLKGHLELILDLPGRPEFAEFVEGLPLDEAGDLALPGFNPRKDLLPLLSGELDVFLMEMPDGGAFNPMQMPVFLVLGTNDGPALRDLILDLADLFGGEGAAGLTEMVRSMPSETVGDFELSVLPFGGSFAVSRDYLVLGLTDGPMREMFTGGGGNLKVPEGRTWTYINGKEYGEAMQGFMEMAAMFEGGDGPDDIEQELMKKMYTPFFEHLESETIYSSSRPDRLVIEADVKGALATGLYSMLYTLIAEMPELVAMQMAEQKANYVIPVLDSALTSYGIDHDGTFPADPRQLVDEGYLEEFPLDVSVPAGTYLDGAYTYLPLVDEMGQIAGYFLFVYGGGEGTGRDVYTGENVLDPENFVIGSDGVPDGVNGFCYDGLALEQMEIWMEK